MNLTLAEIRDYVNQCLESVTSAAETIAFAEQRSRYQKKGGLNRIPQFESLPPYYGEVRWATVLFVDLRGSTQNAVEFGPRNTYLTMHTLIPTLAEILTKSGGQICNFRGDGLFGVFGIDDDGENPTDLQTSAGSVVKEATNCGRAMLEALDGAIIPALKCRDIANDLRIGVGIDKGDIVITRIGLDLINELTAYGSPVNKAAKLCGANGAIILSPGAEGIFPTSEGGKVTFKPYHRDRDSDAGTQPDGFQLVVPTNLKILK